MQHGTGGYSLYRSYYYTLKDIRPGIQRLTFLKRKVRQKGFEVLVKRREKSITSAVSVDKLDNNLSRVKSTVKDLAMCNDWEWWCTLTIDKSKHDRGNLKAYRKAFCKWVTGINRRCKKTGEVPIRYLLVAEKHEDGNWHMHGFMNGMQADQLRNFTLAEKLPVFIREALKDGRELYDWSAYREQFGFISLERIRCQERAASYIIKYVTKDVQRSVTELGEHAYVASQGLKRPKIVKTGKPIETRYPADWENKYCELSILRTPEQRKLADSIIAWDS